MVVQLRLATGMIFGTAILDIYYLAFYITSHILNTVVLVYSSVCFDAFLSTWVDKWHRFQPLLRSDSSG